ncbi:CCD14-like protein [Mya arenaria]|uniref:CCD14-like protein n=1 Tax=Mya arenaria TaxID=6604 RepID=A0ABY7EJ64_MYAAR|nr:uncharacterized protein LOC128239757 [Mya arenaria]XP_052812138.1 uncharacterized protein LOC128239757 [Mya arenaria]WAR10038.1 CCD14-like protein [Mya arenaria]
MFAKPQSKKASTVTKHKGLAKPKAVSVKSGVKGPQQSKRPQQDAARCAKSGKPPPRPEPSYSLYSTDSEDQVTVAFNEMETCEKILTHLKNKQKGGTKTKPKTKKKMKELESNPKALNENPPLTAIVPGISSLYGTPFPYGAAHFLRQLQPHDYASSPIFNSRLASSTPDPDRLPSDLEDCKLPNASESNIPQDVPERDISTVSSVPPNFNHLQNMADMVEIYKQLEIKKAQQIQAAVAKETIEKLNAMDIEAAAEAGISVVKGHSMEGQRSSQGQINQGQSQPKGQFGGHNMSQGQNSEKVQAFQQDRVEVHSKVNGAGQGRDNGCAEIPGRESDGFVGTESLGFTLHPGDSLFRPVAPGGSDHNLDSDMRGGSSLAAFQPYISGDSGEFLPPQHWVLNYRSPVKNKGPTQMTEGGPNMQVADDHQNVGAEVPTSGRTEKSDASGGTDYVTLPRPEVKGQTPGSRPNEVNKGSSVVYAKQNGLFQIHQQVRDTNSSATTSGGKSDESDLTLNNSKGQSSLDEVPERDMPRHNEKAKTSPSKPIVPSLSSKEGTFRIDGQKNDSQNLSRLATLTPRSQNMSSNSGSSSLGGKIVFIPNDSNTPTVIGHVPGIPLITASNQPISLPATLQPQSASMLSSANGLQGISNSQNAAQRSQDVTGSVYISHKNANVIAAGDIGVRKLRYLLKELKECNKVTKDVEVNRLVSDVEDTINSIPQLALTFNLQTEIDLALQPLRSENSQLRRKFRILNQQMKDKDIENEPKDINFEMLHLQTSNDNLQKIIREERDIKTRLAAEVQYLYQEIHKMKTEKSRLIASTSEKETDQLKLRQEMTMEAQKVKHDLDLLKQGHDATVASLEALEKENHILQITLQQRDIEIDRQQEIVETMKASISDLLQELDQSQAHDRAWDHNQSYGLNRLLKIVEEDRGSRASSERYPQRQARKLSRTPERNPPTQTLDHRSQPRERQMLDFDSSGNTTSSTARLTKSALADHNRKNRPLRLGLDGRQGPASESELDTLVEMRTQRHIGEKFSQGAAGGFGERRRRNSSSPVRLRGEIPANYRNYQVDKSPVRGNIGNNRDAGGVMRNFDRETFPRQRERTIGQESDDELEFSPSRRKEVGVDKSPLRRAGRFEEFSPQRGRTADRINSRFDTNQPGETEVSVEQSRYSITDYFKKYHPKDSTVRPKDSLTSNSRPPMGRTMREFPSRLQSQFRTSSEIDDRTAKSSDTNVARANKKLNMFNGHADHTISAIHDDDDNVSSVSMSSVTTANTVDENKFRHGIATLDANIARLQQALQKTKSMLS